MPDSNLCEIIVLLDRSGSMATIAKDTCGGFDTFVQEQAKLPGKCLLTLTQFDTVGIDVVHEGKPIGEVPALVFEPRGGTPLLDAIGQTILKTGKRFADLPDEKRPGKVIFAIITDGEENSSHEFDLPKIKQMIEEQTSKWKWQFTYLGANVDAFDQAGKMGIPRAATASFSTDADHYPETYRSLSSSVGRSRAGAQSVSYLSEEREAMDANPQTAPGTAAPTSSTGK